MPEHTDPVSREEWQDAADAAHGALTLEAARQYGLVTGGPGVNVGRCQEILRKARALGVTPAADAIERYVREHNEEVKARQARAAMFSPGHLGRRL